MFRDSITDPYNDLHSYRVKRKRFHQYSNTYCNGQSYTDSEGLSATIYNMFRFIIHVNCGCSKHLPLLRRSRHRKYQSSITDQYNDLHSNRNKCSRLYT